MDKIKVGQIVNITVDGRVLSGKLTGINTNGLEIEVTIPYEKINNDSIKIPHK